MEAGLRTYKQATLRIAIPTSLPEHMQAHMREIMSVHSANPRKGQATALMYQVCQEADDDLKTLILVVEPFGDEMTTEQLTKWYKKFGFNILQEEPKLMMARQVVPNRIKLN